MYIDKIVSEMVFNDKSFNRLLSDIKGYEDTIYHNVVTKDDSLVIEFEIPRIDPKDCKVTVRDNFIEAEIKDEKIKYKVSDKYNMSLAKLSYEFGTLYVTIPLKEESVIKPITLTL